MRHRKAMGTEPELSEMEKLFQERDSLQEKMSKLDEETYSGNFRKYVIHNISTQDVDVTEACISMPLQLMFVSSVLAMLIFVAELVDDAKYGVYIILCIIAFLANAAVIVAQIIYDVYLDYKYQKNELRKMSEAFLECDEQCRMLEQYGTVNPFEDLYHSGEKAGFAEGGVQNA